VAPDTRSLDDLVDDVIATLDELALERCHIVGLSLGGMMALRLASREPDRVDRLVVMCTATHMPPAAAWTERAELVRAQGTSAVASPVVGRWVTPAWANAHAEAKAYFQAMVSGIDPEGYAAGCEVLARLDVRGDLANVKAPLLAIAGAQDPATPPERLQAIAEGVRDGRLLVVDPAAHLANVEQAQAVNEALVDHLFG
jgi:3-oxoadipate enol-lactonase